jgi:hypothetical protein
MDIQRANAVLVRVIEGMQAAEVQALAEAMASGMTSYNVPPPGMMGGGYRPPKPGVLGPKPKQIRRPRLRKKWAKMPIEIAFGPKGLNVKTVEAWVKGVWAVHKNPRGPGWHLTHVPTGMAAYPNIDSEKTAKSIVDAFLARSPSAFGMGKNKGPDDAREVAAEFRERYVDNLMDVVRELRDPAFLEKFPPGIGKLFRGVDPGRPVHGPDETTYDKKKVY